MGGGADSGQYRHAISAYRKDKGDCQAGNAGKPRRFTQDAEQNQQRE